MNESRGGLLRLAGAALVAGLAAGAIGSAFRLALLQADRWRGSLLELAQGQAVAGLLGAMGGVALCAALAAWLVRRWEPHAGGSGIPDVEAELTGEAEPAPPLRLLGVKFLGGILAIGGGLALGREGPCVQMGAVFGRQLAKLARLPAADVRVLLAAGAGAGLATAFNAPLAGAIFVLEELMRRFDVRTSIATFGASAAAIAIARMAVGEASDFQIPGATSMRLGEAPWFLALGLWVGLLGVLYNRAVLAALEAASRLPRIGLPLRAAGIGALVGALGWCAPTWVGSGDPLTQWTLDGGMAPAALAAVFGVRLVLGPLSYAAGTPGGLFAPMLVIGAQGGLLAGLAAHALAPAVAPAPVTFALAGMAAFFAAVVRAPITGIVLVGELTGTTTALLPMLTATFAAMWVATWLRSAPIYDALRARPLTRGVL